ncbi:MAG: sigma-70 family RNA polymerase sigma factor [Acidimicrobiales bacterium]
MTEGAAEVNDRGSEAAADDAVVDPHTASAPGADDVAPEVLAAELDAIDGDAGDAVVVVGAAEDGMVEVVVEAPVDGGLEVVIAETADGAMEVVTRGGAARRRRRGIDDEDRLEGEDELLDPAAADSRDELARKRRQHRVAQASRETGGGTSDPVRMYLKEIGRVPLLTAQQEVDLAKRIEAGTQAAERLADLAAAEELATFDPGERRHLERLARDGERAKSELTQANLRLVVSIAKRYVGRGMQLLDLVQEGNLGLMRAVEKFDYTKGFKFSTYATWWIRQAITRGIANTGRTIRLPVHAGDTLARLQKARARLELKLGRPATLAELSAEVEMPEDKVTEALRFAAEPLSLSEPLREDGDAELGDVVEDRSAESPFETAATALLPEEIQRLLAPLDEREREILKLRFGLDRGEPRTLEEVGEHFNLTRERIRQIEARAMSKLRHPSSDTGARDLLAV